MSQENVEIVRRVFDAYLAGDVEAALAAYGPKVEFDVSFRPDGGVYRGRDGVIRAMRDGAEPWDSWQFEVEEIIDAGDGAVVVIQEAGRGKESGAEIKQTTFHVCTLRDGKITRQRGFMDRNQALKAAGLSE
jgi:uncharacterized protein